MIDMVDMGKSKSEIEAATSSFTRTRAHIDSFDAPWDGGIYAIYLNSPGSLAPFSEGDDGLIYVGLSRCLAGREFKQHFATGATGFSTLRRSLGSILKEQLLLKAIPRANGHSECNIRNYCFAEECEAALTKWMYEHLTVGIYVTPRFEELEDVLIPHLKPMLNLTKWTNPFRPAIKELRKACADEARRVRSERA